MEFCNQALSLDAGHDSKSVENIAFTQQTEDSDPSVPNTITTFDLTDTPNILEDRTCIECDCNSKSKTICAVRADGERFIIRWFADKCHMLQYNCENNVNFTETDDYICAGDKNYRIDNHSKEPNKTTEETQNNASSVTCLRCRCRKTMYSK